MADEPVESNMVAEPGDSSGPAAAATEMPSKPKLLMMQFGGGRGEYHAFMFKFLMHARHNGWEQDLLRVQDLPSAPQMSDMTEGVTVDMVCRVFSCKARPFRWLLLRLLSFASHGPR